MLHQRSLGYYQEHCEVKLRLPQPARRARPSGLALSLSLLAWEALAVARDYPPFVLPAPD